MPDALVGWGITNESKAVMGTKTDGSAALAPWPTPTNLHRLYKDGNHDGRYAWVKTRSTPASRAGVDFDIVCDKITDPQRRGFHGIFPDKADLVDPAINHTTRVLRWASSPSPCPTTAVT